MEVVVSPARTTYVACALLPRLAEPAVAIATIAPTATTARPRRRHPTNVNIDLNSIIYINDNATTIAHFRPTLK
jgi:hypothetical protein